VLTDSSKLPTAPQVSPGVALGTIEPTQVLTDLQASFRILFMRNPQPMWVYNLKTLQLLEVNDAAVQHYGYSRDEFLQLLLSDIRPQDDVPRSSEDAPEAGTGQHRGEWRHRVKDGRIIAVEIDSHNLAFGKHEAQLVVVRDITKQKAVEQALKQAERKYRLMFEEAIVPNDRVALADRPSIRPEPHLAAVLTVDLQIKTPHHTVLLHHPLELFAA
jgi:PAS domain S-box-containing protein